MNALETENPCGGHCAYHCSVRYKGPQGPLFEKPALPWAPELASDPIKRQALYCFICLICGSLNMPSQFRSCVATESSVEVRAAKGWDGS